MGCHEIHRTPGYDALFSESGPACKKIDIRYSEGYSPHQIMSFAAPLESESQAMANIFDIEVNESMTSKEAVAALNETMVDGVEVTSYVKLPDKAKTAMSIVAAADYRLS